jgi:hypothetical protein
MMNQSFLFKAVFYNPGLQISVLPLVLSPLNLSLEGRPRVGIDEAEDL